jgi:tetraacyldisaccharide 4'-kinase
MGFYEINQSNILLDRNTLKGKTAALICGIGDPDSFENLILSMGINIGLSFRFPDHYNYTQKDLDKIAMACKEKDIDTIVTTEKDAVRLYGLRVTGYGLRIFVLRIKLVITKDEENFYRRLLSLYSL